MPNKLHVHLCLFLFFIFSGGIPLGLMAQKALYSGRVISGTDNKPLAGVSISIKGATAGSSTDAEGKFSIHASEGATLVFSYIGYESYEYTLAGSRLPDIVLQPADKTLQDVVVVGYGTQKKRDLTGSISSVNSKDIQSLPVPNVGEALQGRAAGVQIFSSGSTGSNVSIRVRGTGTINNSDPPGGNRRRCY